METKTVKTSIEGVLKIEKKIFKDHRGIFNVIYKRKEYKQLGITPDFIQSSFSGSKKNVLRGLHGDPKTWKLVSCPYGKLYLVVLDYREESETFGKWEAFTLTPENCLQILIPPGFANGHLVLSDWAIFHYCESEYYTGGSNQFSVKWNDPRFNIDWPVKDPILSKRDGG